MLSIESKKSYTEAIPLVYTRFRQQRFDQQLPVHIFGTSSKGNSIYIKNLRTLIDLGLPYKRYTEYDPNFFLDVDYIILTHEHGDHLNSATLLKVLNMYPNIKFLITGRMAKAIMHPDFSHRLNQERLRPYTLYGPNNRFLFAKTQLLTTRDNVPIELRIHVTQHGDITNIAVEMTVKALNLHMLYASDLDNLMPDPTGLTDGLPHYKDNPFNLIFLEANYDEHQLQEALFLDPTDVKALGNLRHISEQEAWRYVERYLSDDGFFIPLHASSTYGTLIQK